VNQLEISGQMKHSTWEIFIGGWRREPKRFFFYSFPQAFIDPLFQFNTRLCSFDYNQKKISSNKSLFFLFSQGYHTQVACICQLLTTPDYNIIFKTLQENYMNDDIDDYYECIWDLALLESLISKYEIIFIDQKNNFLLFIDNLNIRGYEEKKRLAVCLI